MIHYLFKVFRKILLDFEIQQCTINNSQEIKAPWMFITVCLMLFFSCNWIRKKWKKDVNRNYSLSKNCAITFHGSVLNYNKNICECVK